MLGGNGLPYLAEPVFDYISSGVYDTSVVPTEIIPDSSLRFVVEKVILSVSPPLHEHFCMPGLAENG